MVPQLTLMAAALYSWPVLRHVVESAMHTAQGVLLSKVGNAGSHVRRVINQQHVWTCVCVQLHLSAPITSPVGIVALSCLPPLHSAMHCG